MQKATWAYPYEEVLAVSYPEVHGQRRHDQGRSPGLMDCMQGEGS